jgi:hypothetical protein
VVHIGDDGLPPWPPTNLLHRYVLHRTADTVGISGRFFGRFFGRFLGGLIS